jgi:hypothetical protein
MFSSPPLISGLIKLTPIGRLKQGIVNEFGFIDLRTVEPSLGLPSGTTNTLANSAYFFPVIGVSKSYKDSRKFTGFDTLILRDKKLGFNTRFPTYSVDISGSLRASSSVFNALSTPSITQISNTNTNLVINTPNSVIISNNLRVNGGTVVPNLTASSILTQGITSQNTFAENTIATIYTLTAAEIAGNFNVNGTLTADVVDVKNNILANTLTATNVFTNRLTATNLTIRNNALVEGDLNVTGKIFGEINLDPTTALRYNDQKQLQYRGNISYTFVVCPTDQYSSDDVTIDRSSTGLYDTNVIDSRSVSGVLRPFFKTLQGVFDYVESSGIFGATLRVNVFGSHLYGENRVRGSEASDGGNYSSLSYKTGNINSAFYSAEWIQANHPALYNAGIRGGEFIWSSDGSPIVGEIRQLVIPNMNFRNLQIFGYQNIGNADPVVRYAPDAGNNFYALIDKNSTQPFAEKDTFDQPKQLWVFNKIYNLPPQNLTFRAYVCSDRTKTFGQFSGTTAQTWTENNTQYSITYRPVYMETSSALFSDIRDITFEITSNTTYTQGVRIETGSLNAFGISIACLGESIYTHGALWLNSASSKITFPGDDSVGEIDPEFVFAWNQPSTAGIFGTVPYTNSGPTKKVPDSITPFSRKAILPRHALALIGNPSNKRPTIVWNFDNPNTGLIKLTEGCEWRNVNYGTGNRSFGYLNQNDTQVILAGKWNSPSVFHFENNAFAYISDQMLVDKAQLPNVRTLNPVYWGGATPVTWQFGLSCRNINYNNIQIDGQPTPSYRVSITDDPSLGAYHSQFFRFKGAFSFVSYHQERGITQWNYVQEPNELHTADSTMLTVKNPAATNDTFYVFYGGDTFVDMTRSVISLGSFNQIEPVGSGAGNISKIISNRSIRVSSPANMPDAATLPGYGEFESPLSQSGAKYYRDYYRESQR